MGVSPGEESRPVPLRHRRSRRSRPAARSAHQRGRMERSIRQRGSRRTWRFRRATAGVRRRRRTALIPRRGDRTGRINALDEQRQACDQPAVFDGVEVRRAGQPRVPMQRVTMGPAWQSGARSPPELPTGDEERAGGVISSCLEPPKQSQARATPWPVRPGGASVASRAKAVMPTTTAPTTEKATCQVSEGIVCFTMPCVA